MRISDWSSDVCSSDLLELAGTLTILVGAGLATFLFARRARAGDRTEAYSTFRSALGRSILLGLEFLVAGDIVKSLVINPPLDDPIVLIGNASCRERVFTYVSISVCPVFFKLTT